MSDPSPAIEIFARWMEGREDGSAPEYESLLAAHPEVADELRALCEDWEILHELRSSPSLAHRLRARYGDSADPRVTLDEASRSPAESVLGRLADRTGRETRYRFKGEVARGGQGAIVLVWDEDLRRDLAMKVMLASAEPASESRTVEDRAVRRFLEEAQVTGQLDHPGIVPVHEIGLDAKERVYFTMKLVRGEDLRAVLDKLRDGREGWSRTRALGVLLRVCEAMAYAHVKGVIHRDIKPGNVMVGRFGEVYVMDWGLARVRGRRDEKDLRIRPSTKDRSGGASVEGDPPDSPLVTMDGDVVGTPTYMAPEQARGSQDEVGPHSDVYSVGAILYDLLAGHSPYETPGKKQTSHEVWVRVREGPPEPIETRARDTPDELLAICRKAMARDPRERYSDMGALAEDLRAFLEHRVVSAHRTGALIELSKWVERNRALASSLAAGALALIAGLVVSLFLKAQSDRNAHEASRREQQAQDGFALAERRWQDVRRLSALQDLEDLLAEADRLWPAEPGMIPRYESWIAHARTLIAELPLHVEKRAALRAQALPPTTESREAHPAMRELRRAKGELAARERALVQRRDGVSAEPQTVDWSRFPADPDALNALALERVEPDRRSFGEEPLGLALALRACERATAEQRPHFADTLAQAYFALGRDDEALNASADALADAPAARQPQFQQALTHMEESVNRWTSAGAFAAEEAELATLRARCDALEHEVDERVDWRFPEDQPEARWWNNQLTKLIAGLEPLEKQWLGEDAVVKGHGWSVTRRLAFARRLEAGFAPDGEYTRAWERALPELRALYGGRLDVQIGLVPLGPDPHSGLWEFAHLASGEPPERDDHGELVFSEKSGVVLVLLRGGECTLGVQSKDPAGKNYDPMALSHEGPPRTVTLSTFFLSKFEMTQAQWLGFTGDNPSAWGVNGEYGVNWNRARTAPDLRHPVEQVNWNLARTVSARLGLALPTEAQWEYAARAGTSAPWWTGPDPAQLAVAANVSDAWARDHGGPPGLVYEKWDDGQTAHAAVGSYTPNPFGLYDVLGNVWEWCRDGWDEAYHLRSSARDPWTDPEGSDSCVYRGGSCSSPAAGARSSYRGRAAPGGADGSIGLRPARELE